MPWKHSIRHQRAELARTLRQPLAQLAPQLVPIWGNRRRMETRLARNVSKIPYCLQVYVLKTDGIQITDNIGHGGSMPAITSGIAPDART